MSRKPVPAQSGDKSRTEMTFDSPRALARLFGEFDQNLVALENRLGVYITARGDRIGLEGRADEVAVALAEPRRRGRLIPRSEPECVSAEHVVAAAVERGGERAPRDEVDRVGVVLAADERLVDEHA